MAADFDDRLRDRLRAGITLSMTARPLGVRTALLLSKAICSPRNTSSSPACIWAREAWTVGATWTAGERHRRGRSGEATVS